MSEYTWRELERADMDMAAAHAFAEMEHRERLARAEHIVDGLGEVKGKIVRCRDCKHFERMNGDEGMCMVPDDDGNPARFMVDDCGYCYRGIRRVD